MKIVFQHIPKCAGSSVHNLLRRNFSDAEIFPERFNAVEKYSHEEILKYKVFCGHYDAWRVGLIPGPKFVFTFLRDPVERVLSLYNFWRSHTWQAIDTLGLEGPRLAKTQSLIDFLNSTNVLVSSSAKNLTVRLALGKSECPSLARLIKNDPDRSLEMAIRYYESLDFVGTTESIDQDIVKVCENLGIDNSALNHVNKTSRIDATTREEVEDLIVTENEIAVIREMNKLDLKIHMHFSGE